MPAVDAAITSMGGDTVANADSFWDAVREHTHEFFNDAPKGLWRLSLPTVAPALSLPGEQFIEWGGAQRWLKTDADVATIRAAAEKAGGHACAPRVPQISGSALLGREGSVYTVLTRREAGSVARRL